MYEIYVRSFADSDGDGVGDVAGIRSRLPYLRELGVNDLWITPWYPSPMIDGGYDVADYLSIDPRLGDLAGAAGLIEDAHRLGLRVLADLVPNHTSSQHPWFIRALSEPPGSAGRARYIFRDGRGTGGDEPPNDWGSAFGGPAWTRISEADGRPGQWYLHSFAPHQPDLDWSSAEVRSAFEAILRHWFDLGLDGFRIDVAMGLVKRDGLPDAGPMTHDETGPMRPGHPQWDQDGVHELYASWRRIADTYPGGRVLVGEVHAPDLARVARYVRGGELDAVFSLPFLKTGWRADALRQVIEATLAAHRDVGALPMWVLSSHDEVRQVTRFGREGTEVPSMPAFATVDTEQAGRLDVRTGTRRARAAALLMLALPGSVCLFQGEELGLPEVEDLPDDARQDPIWTRSGGAVAGRDGCRVPIPWSGEAPPFGFGPAGSTPWLPQPADWADFSVERQLTNEDSTLALYRSALRVRAERLDATDESVRWLDTPPGSFAFERSRGVRCVVNVSADPLPLDPGRMVLVSSEPLGGSLPPGSAIWDAPRASAA